MRIVTNLIFLSLVVASCTSNEIIDTDLKNQENPINFHSTVANNAATRAVTTDNLTKFYVFGGHVNEGASGMSEADIDFKNVETTKSDDNWTYSTDRFRYWIKDAIYNFYAYSCDNGQIPEGKGQVNFYDFDSDYEPIGYSGFLIGNCSAHSKHYLAVLTITDYICDSSNQKDLVYASQSYFNDSEIIGLPSSNPNVAFTFQHILSQIRVSFKAEGISNNYVTKITDLNIVDFYNKADYRPSQFDVTDLSHEASQLAWRGHTTDGTPALTPVFNDKNDALELSTSPINSEYMYVIPCSYPETKPVTIHFTAKIYDKQTDCEELVVAKNFKTSFTPNWKAGHAYSYNFVVKPTDLDLNVVEFTTVDNGVSDWIVNTPSDMTIEAYN